MADYVDSKHSGQTLVSLSRFQSYVFPKVQKFEEDTVPEGWNRDSVNLECGELLQRSQKDIIEAAIDQIILEESTMGPRNQKYTLQENTERCKQLCTPDTNPCRLHSYDRFKHRSEEEIKTIRSHKQINYIASMMKEQPQSPEERVLDPNELILTVALYHPSKALKQQEFQVLGSQPLTHLRDRLYCLADYLGDGRNTKSGFFLIEGTFYNDMRMAENLDYSKPYIDWASQNNRAVTLGIGLFSAKKMEDTSFIDLAIRIGQPYLYVHQGNCEHSIVFNEVRLVHQSDVQTYSSYPRHVFQAKIRRRKCKICDTFPARYVTYNDRMATEDPFFYCEHCYRPLHYDFEGRVLYSDFEVFPYYHE